ncbi:8186_t:CDS:2 [Cetraspora pellucida]|uniref:8186_t:CDS:1 n=1 Tax=Cetraspora pellucida TaxID=1433469 RepID=A0A9N9JP68_9GLOM|nr:8186_t:CDS:2 [Cetraspora pellucida]
MNEPDINDLNMNKLDINEHEMNKPDIIEPDINEPNINENNILEKCTNHYKALVEHYENEVLLSEEMPKKLFNEISLVGSDEYFENDFDRINFKSIIGLNDFKNQGDTSQEIAKKIANLIDDTKKPRKHQDPECQRDHGSIECFDYSGTLRISINMITNNASIYLKHKILYK